MATRSFFRAIAGRRRCRTPEDDGGGGRGGRRGLLERRRLAAPSHPMGALEGREVEGDGGLEEGE